MVFTRGKKKLKLVLRDNILTTGVDSLLNSQELHPMDTTTTTEDSPILAKVKNNPVPKKGSKRKH